MLHLCDKLIYRLGILLTKKGDKDSVKMSEYFEKTSKARHEQLMMKALEQAHLAKTKNEVPVGAVLVAVSYTHLTLPTKA